MMLGIPLNIIINFGVFSRKMKFGMYCACHLIPFHYSVILILIGKNHVGSGVMSRKLN